MVLQEFKELHTKRLDLKPLVATFEFANYLFNLIAKNRDFFRFMPFVSVEKPEDEFDFLRRAEETWKNRNAAQYGMFLRKTGEFVGVCSIFDLSSRRESGELGYWLDPKYANKGYMTEAVNAITNEFFKMGFKRIVIKANPKNITSCKVAEKCGFIKEGLMKSVEFNPYLKKREDFVLYAKIKK